MKRVKESNTKLAKALSLVTARSAEMEAMKKRHVEDKQKFYNMGFFDTKDSLTDMVTRHSWVAALDALKVPLNSPFRVVERIPYPTKLVGNKSGASRSSTQVPKKGVPIAKEQGSSDMEKLLLDMEVQTIAALTNVMEVEDDPPL